MELLLGELAPRERYKFLTALVIPRPVALVTTRDAAGLHNAAPFSFFNVFAEEPPLVVLGFNRRPDGRTKNTLDNIRATGQFVVNMVDRTIIEAMHICSADVPQDESEIDFTDLTLAPGRTVEVKHIAQAPVGLECRVYKIMDVSEERTLVIGEVLCIHVQDALIDPATRRVIPESYAPIARLYGDHYAWLGERYTRAIPSYAEISARRPRRDAAE